MSEWNWGSISGSISTVLFFLLAIARRHDEMLNKEKKERRDEKKNRERKRDKSALWAAVTLCHRSGKHH